jgi:hypothetical protein
VKDILHCQKGMARFFAGSLPLVRRSTMRSHFSEVHVPRLLLREQKHSRCYH